MPMGDFKINVDGKSVNEAVQKTFTELAILEVIEEKLKKITSDKWRSSSILMDAVQKVLEETAQEVVRNLFQKEEKYKMWVEEKAKELLTRAWVEENFVKMFSKMKVT